MEYLKIKDSSSIEWVGYDKPNRVLHVQFKDNETEYEYSEVPVKKWKELKEADSKGEYINVCIKPFHTYNKV
ncbi:MAG: KTSC domain-containing protein [Chitinophagaceae bacterium]|nr:KTSC domain-containing protein [Chitinophagaceae bacterium]